MPIYRMTVCLEMTDVVNNSIFDNTYVNLAICENYVWKNYDFCIDCSKKISEAVHRTIEENKDGENNV